MRFTVPQFIEREAKILGPMTFKQTLFMGGAGAVILVLYFAAPFLVFIMAGAVLAATGIGLAFFSFSGRPMPIFLTNIFKFLLEAKTYIWKKKEQPLITYKKSGAPVAVKEIKEGLPLKIAEKSRLKKLQTEIETRTK